MSTPTWVRFSSVNTTIKFLLENTSELLKKYQFKLREVARLKWNLAENEMEFDDDGLIKIENVDEVYDITAQWDGFALAYTVFSIGVYMYLYFWKREGMICLAVETDTQTPYLETDQLVKGEWLERFLCAYTACCNAKIGAYGHYYPIEYEPIFSEVILAELKTGNLLVREPGLSFYMISGTLLSAEEELALLYRKHPQLRYFQTISGYHIFSSLTASSS